jgi:hypothetical protein
MIHLLPPLKRLKKYAILFTLLLIIKIPWALIMSEDGARLLSGDTKTDILSRRNYLIDRVHLRSAGTGDMPSILNSQFQGEWAVGTYSMLTAALTNIAFLFPETREESLRIVDNLIERVRTPEIRQFDTQRWGEDPLDSLSGNAGHIGYLGHLNWMIGAHYFLGGDKRYSELYSAISSSLYRRLRSSPALCLETYPQEIYVPDNVVVFASIANFAKLHNGKYGDLLTDWVTHARNNLRDSALKLLPFHLDPNCKIIDGVRGSGAGWNSYYLPFIDQTFASEQFENIKNNLVQKFLITGIREYPKGIFGIGDVDSGPVLLGFSPSGTGFAVGGAAHAKDASLLTKLLFTSELVGSSVQWNDERYYLLAPLVGEAIMLGMKTARVWDQRYVVK